LSFNLNKCLSGVLLIITGLLYFMKTFKYKRIHTDEPQEDDNLFDTSNSISRLSISTQTSVMGLNQDNLSSAVTMEQEINKKH
jgi:putative Mn2+ efflux pump MntP